MTVGAKYDIISKKYAYLRRGFFDHIESAISIYNKEVAVMNFQDLLKANARTKDEAINADNKELVQKATETAEVVYDGVKARLISLASEAKYSVQGSKKIVSCIYTLPDDFQFYYLAEDRSVHISATPSTMDTMLGAMIGKSKREARNILRKQNGRGISTSNGSPAQHYPAAYFCFNAGCEAEINCFLEKIKQFARQDKIDIELCVYDKYKDIDYPLFTEIKGIYADKFYYSLSLKCSCAIPDKFSSDVPISVTEEIAYSTETKSDIGKSIDIDSMEGHDFEKFCARILSRNGFEKVDVTRGSGDQGIDIIAYKDGIRYGIQCKCHSSDIGNKAVQEAFAGKTYYKCHVAIVLTNRYFTRSAMDLAETNGIILWDRTKLLELNKKASVRTGEK